MQETTVTSHHCVTVISPAKNQPKMFSRTERKSKKKKNSRQLGAARERPSAPPPADSPFHPKANRWSIPPVGGRLDIELA